MTFLKGQKFPRNPSFVLPLGDGSWTDSTSLFGSFMLTVVQTAVKGQPHRGNGRQDTPKAHGVSQTIYHHVCMWLPGVKGKGWEPNHSMAVVPSRGWPHWWQRKANKRNILSTCEWNKDPTEKTEVSSRGVKSTEMGAVCRGGIWFQCKHP